jgi:hypothetical protein
MNDTMTLVWGGYSVRFFQSDKPINDWENPKWRYEIKDPDKGVHPSALTGNSLDYAVQAAVADIEAREARLALEAKRLAIEAEAEVHA